MSLKSKIEAVIYASEEPVTLTQLVGALGEEVQAELDRQPSLDLPVETPPEEAVADAIAESTEATEAMEEPSEDGEKPKKKKLTAAEKAAAKRLRGHLRGILDELVAEYAAGGRGIEIREVAGGYRFATKPEFHDTVRGFIKSLKPPLKLTLQSLETLAVIAYKQPVTAPEISEIRGVDTSGVLGSLMARKLITTAGRKQVIGRPILYKTTKDFLLRFGLKDVTELPSIEEFEAMAGELAEQEEIRMLDPTNDPGRTTVEPQADGGGNVADEVIVDGRISGLPPRQSEESDDPSAQEAEEQEAGKE